MSKLADKIKSVVDTKLEKVFVPEWNVNIVLKGMTGKQRDLWEMDVATKASKGDVVGSRAKTVIMCAYDEEDNPVFEPADIAWLQEKNSCVLQRLFDKILVLSGIGKEEQDSIEKN